MVVPSLIMLYSLRHYFADLLQKARQRDIDDIAKQGIDKR